MGGFDGDAFLGVATRAGFVGGKAIVARWSPRPETDALWGIEVSLLTSAATSSGRRFWDGFEALEKSDG